MLLTPLLTAMLETALNRLLYQDRSMKAARARLAGKALRIHLYELDTPLTLLFSKQQLDVLSQWEGTVDGTVTTRISTLLQLRDRQQLAPLMRSGALIVDGDLQVVQQLVALIDLAEWEPAEVLAPYVGDIVAQGITQTLQKGGNLFKSTLTRQQHYLRETLTEEWKLAPGSLQVVWFNEEVTALENQINALSARIDVLENRP